MIRVSRLMNRTLLALLVLLVVLVAAAPQLLSRPAIRNWILGCTLPLDGRIAIGRAQLGWFSPVRLEQVEIVDRQGRRAVAVGTIDGDRPLWRVVLHPRSPGTFRLQQVQLDVIFEPDGTTNLARLIDRERLLNMPALGVEITDAMVLLHKPDVPVWQFGPFRVSYDFKTQGPPSGRELVVRPGRVLDKAVITSPKSSGLLKYALPVLADANVWGQLSLELDSWRMPLASPEKAVGSGRLVIHRLEVEPGPLIRQLADVLGNSTSFRLAQDATVPFSMADGRIHHRDLQFTLCNLTLRTHGSVGVDQTLDLVAEVEFPHDAISGLPLFDAMKKLSIPVRGTLDRPELDRTALRESNKDLLRNALDGLLRRRTERKKSAI